MLHSTQPICTPAHTTAHLQGLSNQEPLPPSSSRSQNALWGAWFPQHPKARRHCIRSRHSRPSRWPPSRRPSRGSLRGLTPAPRTLPTPLMQTPCCSWGAPSPPHQREARLWPTLTAPVTCWQLAGWLQLKLPQAILSHEPLNSCHRPPGGGFTLGGGFLDSVIFTPLFFDILQFRDWFWGILHHSFRSRVTATILEAHIPLCLSRVTGQPQAAPKAGPRPVHAASGSTSAP